MLCESVVTQEKMIYLLGGGISDENTFFAKLIKKCEQSTISKSPTNLPFKKTWEPDKTDLESLILSIHEAGLVLVIDDFHYISGSAQKSLVEQFRNFARQHAKIIIISILHRSDDAIRANPDLKGRVYNIEIDYWQKHELRSIPEKGFDLLNVKPSPSLLDRMVIESISSPQLMQALCLQLCSDNNIVETQSNALHLNPNPIDIEVTLGNAKNITNSQTSAETLVYGPNSHGSPREILDLTDGTQGDVYYLLLKAISGDPVPSDLSYKYQEIKKRVDSICKTPPQKNRLTSALKQMDKIVQDQLQPKGDRVLEWNSEKEILYVLDPYFLYDLRWSEVLKR